VPAEPAGPAAATAPAAAPAAAPAEAPPGLGATPGTPLGRNDAAAAAALAGGETLVPVAPPVLGALSEADAGAETARRAPQGGRSKQAATPGVLDGLAAAAPLAAPPPAAADLAPAPAPDTEAFANAERHRVTRTAEQPVSTFSIDVDTASYAVVRASLMAGMLPPPEAVRIEEMVNYFPYDYPAPEAGEAPFRPTVTVMPAPWAEGRRLVQIGLQGRMPALADRPPLNLVFLIDTSGSMEDANKLPLLKQSLRLMLPNLRPEDEVAIVAYAGSAGEVLPPTAAGEAAAISAALDRLDAGGATAGAEGLELAYQVAARMAGAGEVTRVLLATDGDFNVGLSDPAGLEAYIARKRASGTYLSVLGFGRGNLDDATMQALAQAGNGTAAYIDTLGEARKVLVDQLTGALFPIADDVKVQVEWNPAEVAEWRLIGYETRGLRREDFNNDRVDAGEIGAGHSVTAIYEITAPDSPALASDPLRYGTAVAAADGSGELGFLRLRYKEPGGGASRLIELPITPAMAPVGDDARFAAAIAGFGQLLTGATHLGDWGWQEAIALALAGRGEDPYGYRNEAVGLMRLAESLSR
jgi:Ca-activated chloride channel family protein